MENTENQQAAQDSSTTLEEMTLDMWDKLDDVGKSEVLIRFFSVIAKLSKFANETVTRVNTHDSILSTEFPKYRIDAPAEEECCGGVCKEGFSDATECANHKAEEVSGALQE